MSQHTSDKAARAVLPADTEARYSYDPALRGTWAEREYALHQSQFAFGTWERARFLLDVINRGFPTPQLTEEYFATLDVLLDNRPVLSRPGQLVLGLGTGRTGSTSLAALLSTIPNTIATHENPPQLFWEPLQVQLDFHTRRFRKLVRHMPLVADIAHWWLPAVAAMRSEFPDMRCIALERDVTDCVNSFLTIKGRANAGLNHWAPAQNGLWTPGLWDATYPSYPLLADALLSRDSTKEAMIRRYISEYNDRLRALAATAPQDWLLLRTETLSDPQVQKAIFEFAGGDGIVSHRRWNVGSIQDSEARPFWI